MTETIKFEPHEKLILQSAVTQQISQLEKLAKKAASLGVETTNAVQKDLNTLKDLETKLL